MAEFSIINDCFRKPFSKERSASSPPTVSVGIGDDAAVIQPFSQGGDELVVCVDTLVENVHFLSSCPPEDVAFKALAVNLSDLAAMGAEPKWMTLAITLPNENLSWLNRFSSSLTQIADQYGVILIGGDTTQGPLSVSVQLLGTRSHSSRSLLRSEAKPGQLIAVSGEIGAAALGLDIVKGWASIDDRIAVTRLQRPEPRLALGQLLGQYASACIDVSDGLGADLAHICRESRVVAAIDLDRIPIYSGLFDNVSQSGSADKDWELAVSKALFFGDDYELLFTIDPDDWVMLSKAVEQISSDETRSSVKRNGIPLDRTVTIIGEVIAANGSADDHLIHWRKSGRHFEFREEVQFGYEHFQQTESPENE